MEKINKILCIKKLIKEGNLQNAVSETAKEYEVNLISRSNKDYEIRFSKTKAKTKYKVPLESATHILVGEMKTSILKKLINLDILKSYKVTEEELLKESHRICRDYYCMNISNIFILKFDR